jgi:hypothetical protein
MERNYEVFVDGCEERRFDYRDTSRQCEHRQRLKNKELKSKDFFDVKESPVISFKPRRSFRPVQTPSS